MKRIKNIILLCSAAFITNSCQQGLLDTNPYQAIGSGQMWTNESLADMGVNAIYNTFRYDRIGRRIYVYDALANVSQNRDGEALLQGTATTGSDLFSGYWKEHYEGVSRANDAISNLPEKAPLSADKMGRLVAESKFLRAFFYYRLNEVFKGVPIYTTPISVSEYTQGRETETKVWEFIINDLTDCINEPNFPNRYEKGNSLYGRATKGAAYALRGKVYMWLKEWAKAEADFKKVGEAGYKLFDGSYSDLFKEANEQCEEMIFTVQNIGVVNCGSDTQKALGTRSSYGSGWNTFCPNPDHVDSYANIDGSPFNWDDIIPGYNSMNPNDRVVFFLRDNITDEEKGKINSTAMSQYLPEGNEARIMKAYENRDPRLKMTIITPYSTYRGALSGKDNIVTLRHPYRTDNLPEQDLQLASSGKYYYLYRKFVYEGLDETPNRDYGPIDQPIIRYADILLLQAEALNEQGKTAEAIECVNKVRARAGVALLNSNPYTQVTDQENMRERIRNERRWELNCEGVLLFDEMRWKTWENTFKPTNGTKEIWGSIYKPCTAWKGDYMYVWPIPLRECQMNTNLIQNDGWTN